MAARTGIPPESLFSTIEFSSHDGDSTTYAVTGLVHDDVTPGHPQNSPVEVNVLESDRFGVETSADFDPFLLPSIVEQDSERAGAVKRAPGFGAAEQTLDGEGRSEKIAQDGKTNQLHDTPPPNIATEPEW